MQSEKFQDSDASHTWRAPPPAMPLFTSAPRKIPMVALLMGSQAFPPPQAPPPHPARLLKLTRFHRSQALM